MHTNQMPFLAQGGGRFYSLLLLCYPASLRAGFQQEMLSVFEDQIHFAWEKYGYRGVVQCWLRAIMEMLCVALPARLDALRIPVLSILLGLFLTACFFAYVAPSAHCAK